MSWRRSDPAGKPKAIFLWKYAEDSGLAQVLQDCGWNVVLATQQKPTAWSPDYDLGFNFLAPWRIPQAELGPDCKRWVNFHRGPLPGYRGRCGPYYAIMERWSEFGVSLHYMDAGLDTGDIIEVRRFHIGAADTAGSIMRRARWMMIDLLYEWAPRLVGGPVPVTPQSKSEGRYVAARGFGSDAIPLSEKQQRLVRALTVEGTMAPSAMIGGRRYRIVPEDHL